VEWSKSLPTPLLLLILQFMTLDFNKLRQKSTNQFVRW
jgi:hypothetical protein